MKIESVRLKNFRNYNDEKVFFSEGLNVIVGQNAQGKTNLLEALFFCSIGKSMRVSKEKEVIGFTKENAKIEVVVKKQFSKTLIEIFFSSKDKKSIRINNIPIKRIGELLGELNCVYFSPDELSLIKDSPEDRRRFMDVDISQSSKTYFYLLSRYEKILESRNKLLKSSDNFSSISELLSVYDEQLALTGSKIIFSRIRFIEKLAPYASLAHEFLTSKKENLILSYVGIVKDSSEEVRKEMLTLLKKAHEKDFRLGFTSVGPHRDDIKVVSNGIDVRTYGSQGQQRTCALSMKLAELEIIKNETGEMPVLLLDDVFSELDLSRKERLLKFSSKAQTIITGTEFFETTMPFQKHIVTNGNVKSV